MNPILPLFCDACISWNSLRWCDLFSCICINVSFSIVHRICWSHTIKPCLQDMYNSLKRFCSEVLSAVSVRWARNGLVPLLLLRLGPTSFETRASAFDLQQLPPQYLLMLRRNRKFLSARTISALVASAELPPLIIVLRTVLNWLGSWYFLVASFAWFESWESWKQAKQRKGGREREATNGD